MLISSTEPLPIRQLGKSSQLPEKYGVDMLIVNKYLFGIQRKQFPSDFIASLTDGRLQREILQMSKLYFAVLLLEGIPIWTNDGWMLDRHRISINQLLGIIWSLQLEGISTHWTKDTEDTVRYLTIWERWVNKGKHDSLFRRPKPKSPMYIADKFDYQVHFLQGINGVGVDTARNIIRYFDGEIPLEWRWKGKEITKEELMKIPGVGKSRAEIMIKFFKKGV